MKTFFKVLVYTIAGVATFITGAWLWNNGLSDRVDNLKERFTAKFKQGGA